MRHLEEIHMGVEAMGKLRQAWARHKACYQEVRENDDEHLRRDPVLMCGFGLISRDGLR